MEGPGAPISAPASNTSLAPKSMRKSSADNNRGSYASPCCITPNDLSDDQSEDEEPVVFDVETLNQSTVIPRQIESTALSSQDSQVLPYTGTRSTESLTPAEDIV